MFERLMVRADRLAEARAARRRERLAAAVRAREAPGVTVSQEGERVVLSGRGLAARALLEPEQRWLVAESKDG